MILHNIFAIFSSAVKLYKAYFPQLVTACCDPKWMLQQTLARAGQVCVSQMHAGPNCDDSASCGATLSILCACILTLFNTPKFCKKTQFSTKIRHKAI